MSIRSDPPPAPPANANHAPLALKVAFEMHNAGRHAEAEAICQILLPTQAADGQLRFLLGMILHKTGRSIKALGHLEYAAGLPAPSARALHGLGNVRQHLQDFAGAAAAYDRAIGLGLRSGDLFYSAGNACYQLGEMDRAITLFQSAVNANPADAPSWNNLGKCLKELNRLEESLAAYDRALAADPHYPLAHYGRTIVLLTTGHLAEGFREYNQWRFQHRARPRVFPQPAWDGRPIPGQTLFLHAEQGFGDGLMYARFVRRARELAATVILECRPELKTLMEYSACADVVISFGEPVPEFDCFASLLSLPGLLGTTGPTIPRETPYLKAPPSEPLPPAPDGHCKVGLVWAGNPEHHNDAARSLSLAGLAPLWGVPAITFYSLQLSVPAQDAAAFSSSPRLVDVRARLSDFLHTAAVVAQLDLVIAVDTAVAHLAGALGTPVWTLLPFSPDWRWFMDRSDTPWYPTMRLFRQARRGDWTDVLQRVAAELARFTPLQGGQPS